MTQPNGHDAAVEEERDLFPAEIASLDEVDGEYRLLYSEQNGRYCLLPEVKQRHDEIRAAAEARWLRLENERLKLEVERERWKGFCKGWAMGQHFAPKPKPEPEKQQADEFQAMVNRLRGTLGH